MHYTLEQQEAAAEANARTFLCVVMAAYLRRTNSTLSYCESILQSYAMPMDERVARLISATTGEDVPYGAY